MPQLQDLFGVRGLVAVITGGGSGIGLMAAKALDEHGAKAVYIIGRRRQKLEDAAKQARNGSIIPLEGDATSQDSLTAMVTRIKDEQGYINVLFANAGTMGVQCFGELPDDRHPTVQEFQKVALSHPIDDFATAYKVNISSPYYTAVAFLELLDAGNKQGFAQQSQVIVTASIGGSLRQSQDGWAYSTSKAAAVHLVKMMSTYFGPWGIRANCIAPGLYPSQMTAQHPALQREKPITEPGAMPSEIVPATRSGTDEDIQGAILFLTSRAGAYINGNTLVTDGGRLGQTPAAY
ncbi:hypothetical protein LTR78_005309 [Recurvomyces mirabilis]|uniref:Uncharacterized protein n=1 Tax=Recurvomyces mirabilis TaxID=574656 RepID=A0AAE0WNP0_9PEZI|nr:hypothetical protein LTR78_005309 [Recurvomyces mirabilis]KAK5157859.1 hypothetical protein LTS14_003781 [Recurvomyces mirabilis]